MGKCNSSLLPFVMLSGQHILSWHLRDLPSPVKTRLSICRVASTNFLLSRCGLWGIRFPQCFFRLGAPCWGPGSWWQLVRILLSFTPTHPPPHTEGAHFNARRDFFKANHSLQRISERILIDTKGVCLGMCKLCLKYVWGKNSGHDVAMPKLGSRHGKQGRRLCVCMNTIHITSIMIKPR